MMRIDTLFNGVANTFIVMTEKGVWVIDPGMTRQAGRIIKKLRALGQAPEDVGLILLTHGHIDHAGSAAELKRLTGAPIAMHHADIPLVATSDMQIPPGRNRTIDAVGAVLRRAGRVLPFQPFAPDVCLAEGDALSEFGAAARVVETPGHTAGSISFAFPDGTVFVGDAILNLVRVSFPLWWEDPAAARASACKIQALEPRLCYSGHGRAFERVALDQFVARHCQ